MGRQSRLWPRKIRPAIQNETASFQNERKLLRGWPVERPRHGSSLALGVIRINCGNAPKHKE